MLALRNSKRTRSDSKTPECVAKFLHDGVGRRVQRRSLAHPYVTRGSAFAYAMSVIRFTNTKTALRNSTEP